MKTPAYILGIETSCDETAAAIVASGWRICSNVVASQVDIHSPYGGVVPEVASRQHLLWLPSAIDTALSEARVNWNDLSAIAVTVGPGLAGSLLVGVNMAKALAFARGLPIIGVNHLEGHIYANWLVEKAEEGSRSIPFPNLCLIISGGHSELVLMEQHGVYRRLGRTRDDAAGEAFDKVGRILGLAYPGGPAIEKAARLGDPKAYRIPRAWLRSNDDFSFSGMKTAMVRLVKDLQRKSPPGGEAYPSSTISDLASSFQQAMIDVLVEKTLRAAERYSVKQILLGGGVAANRLLLQTITSQSPLPVLCPPPNLCTDNAAMIAAVGFFRFERGHRDGLNLDVSPNLPLV